MKIRERHRRKRPTGRAQLVRYERDDGPLSDAVFTALAAAATGRLPAGLVQKVESRLGVDDDDAP